MAARKFAIRQDDQTRAKIQAAQIINRLQGCVMGEIELTPVQVSAAKILLGKILPDLQSTENKTEITTQNVVALPSRANSTEEWKASVSTHH